jgi:hypothetical protein
MVFFLCAKFPIAKILGSMLKKHYCKSLFYITVQNLMRAPCCVFLIKTFQDSKKNVPLPLLI